MPSRDAITIKVLVLWMLLALSLSSSTTNQIQLTSSIPSARFHTCIIIYGQITCWGRNNWGQLGLGNNDDYLSPPGVSVSLPFGFEPIRVTAGKFHSCALSDDGRVICR